jgi:hypothetical protein
MSEPLFMAVRVGFEPRNASQAPQVVDYALLQMPNLPSMP